MPAGNRQGKFSDFHRVDVTNPVPRMARAGGFYECCQRARGSRVEGGMGEGGKDECEGKADCEGGLRTRTHTPFPHVLGADSQVDPVATQQSVRERRAIDGFTIQEGSLPLQAESSIWYAKQVLHKGLQASSRRSRWRPTMKRKTGQPSFTKQW